MKPDKSPTAVVDSFEAAFPELSNSSGPRGTGLDQQRDRNVREAIRRTIRQGWKNYTVVNLHRFPLDLNMAYLGHLTVPGKKEGTLYFKLAIDQPRFDQKDMGDAKFECVPVFPKELAEDLIREYQETGGVFCFEGTGDVPKELLEEAIDKQLNWYWQLFHEGNRLWNEKHNALWINDRMKDAAKELVAKKLVSIAPDWVTISASESPNKACDGCGTTIARVARFCPTCNQIYDVEWVQVHRPDIWRKVNGFDNLTVSAGQVAGASGASAPDIERLIKEEKTGTAPSGKTK